MNRKIVFTLTCSSFLWMPGCSTIEQYEKIEIKEEKFKYEQDINSLGGYGNTAANYINGDFVNYQYFQNNVQAAVNMNQEIKDIDLNEPKEALTKYRKAISVDKNNLENWRKLGDLLNKLGEMKQAIAVYDEILLLGKRNKNQEEMAFAYSRLGDIYLTRNELEKSETLLQYAMKLYSEQGDEFELAKVLGNLSTVLRIMGDINKANEIEQKAIAFYHKALSLHQALGNKKNIATDYIDLGKC